MKDFNSIEYENSFLNQVIIRVDFLQFLQTDKLFCENIEKEILKEFPRRGIDQKIRFNTINVVIDPNEINPPNAQKESLEGIQREYYKGKNKLILSNKCIVYEINEYDTFDVHFQIFQTILFALFSKQRFTSARIGIRYINLFPTERIKLRKNMFSPEISATFNAKDFVSDKGSLLIRSMTLNEYQVSNMTLNFRYGMFNPDYPNPLNKDSFSLDYDCFTTEPLETTDFILDSIKKGHDAIQELFEASISDSLRKVLSNE